MHTKETELAPKRLLLTIAILLFLIVFVIISLHPRDSLLDVIEYIMLSVCIA